MFARTKRLMLRPSWPEDAPALAAAIGEARVARMLTRVPHPYTLADAQAFVALPRSAHDARFLVFAHEGDAPELVGGIGISDEGGTPQLGYWLKPDAWGRGYATEAGRAVIDMARHALPIGRLGAWHFLDNPASGRVLHKLGFRPTGAVMAKASAAREGEFPSAAYVLDLDGRRSEPVPIAA